MSVVLDAIRKRISQVPVIFLGLFASHLIYLAAAGKLFHLRGWDVALLDAAGIFLCLWMLQLYQRLAQLLKNYKRRESMSSHIFREKAKLRKISEEEGQRLELLLQEIQDLKNQVERLHLAREVHRLRSDLRDGMNATLYNHARQLSEHLSAEEVILFLIDGQEKDRLFPKAHVRGGTLLRGKELNTSPEWLAQTRAPEAVEYGQVMMSSFVDATQSRQVAFFSIPISYDGNVLGALTVVVDPDRGEEITQDLQEVAGSLGLRIHNLMMYEKAITDGLTGLYVHAHFEDRLNELFEHYKEAQSVFSLVMIDIDHFKKFNDTHGHQTGDEVLRGVSRLAQQAAGDRGTAFRYGGEEMSFLLPGVSGENAFKFADRFRKVIEKHIFRSTTGEDLHVTISLGVSSVTPDLLSAEQLVSQADKALYESKKGGRNRTTQFQAGVLT